MSINATDASSKTHITLLDNFDSFTWNLVDQFRSLGYPVTVYRNDIDAKVLADKLLAQVNPGVLVLSPGPGAPHEAGCLMELISLCAGKLPMLGICLGHQAMIEHYGGKVGRAAQLMHGKSSPMQHNNSALFAGLPNPLQIARYHSLVGLEIPTALTVTAEVDGMAMAIVQPQDRAVGFQFHPESILTEHGAQLLRQTLTILTKEEPLC
ncbi:aminodeoxychorismate/anthranilate synthase component II [Ferrimonas lipolytica]|uniref:anthranilate synthase n=1 Tax=Ferrimonas lipolytica TaxID=2724191 RepID=A0A6H1UA00_9GAMM|nr:aminodeoxychorismate/anthranilate synthase component II [Ferrimonas lipolytica]QIZ75871.1 aminodeoxychorismate/anthranilate synthase component II [Ferrimonas lipolytica]